MSALDRTAVIDTSISRAAQVKKGITAINNRYQLLVVDIDGTLVNKNGTLSTEDKEAIIRAGAAGIRVALSTGRVAQASLTFIRQMALDGYHIFADGALVSNPSNGKEVYAEPITPETARQMVEYARQYGIAIELYTASQYFVERESWSSDIRLRFFGLKSTVADFDGIWQRERIIKGTITARSAEEKAKADAFYRHFAGNLDFSWTKTPAYPDIDFINVLAPRVSKGVALEALASHLGIALTEVMAIGDGANDITLLSRAGLAVAMGNAAPEVKAVADYVTLDVGHNGVAAAIEKFLFQAAE